MRLKILRADDSILHLALIGRLDVQGVTEIQHEFLQRTTWAPKNTMVDLSEVGFVASFGISMLVSAAKEMDRQGARMVLLNPTPLVRNALEMSSLQDIIPIATAEMAAIDLFG